MTQELIRRPESPSKGAESSHLGAGKPPITRARALNVKTKATVILAGIIAAFVLVWDLNSRLGWVDSLFVSSPIAVFQAVLDLANQEAVWLALGETGSAIVIAFVVGTSSGVVAGMVIGLSSLIRDAYFGTILFFMSTPKVIFVPIFLLLFGISPTAAAAYGAFEAFFYVTVAVVGGVGLIQERHMRIARVFKANHWHQFVDVILPAASPGIFTGLWFGIKHAFLGVIVVELYASVAGLGKLVRFHSDHLAVAEVLALVGTVVVAAVVLGSMWNRLEARLTRWRPDPTGSQLL